MVARSPPVLVEPVPCRRPREWIKDPRFGPARETEPLGTGGALALASRRIEADRFFAANGDSWSGANLPRMLELHDAVKTDQVRHNGALRTLPGGAQVAACPVRAAQWDEAPDAPAPRLGADTNEVLSALLGLQGGLAARRAQRNRSR
jgi:crotonobetainyl-CoA:carnitine CoA-transferase CaiB-like acyl-CoA transferase